MGLKKIVGIRQYTDFTPAGKVIKMFEVTFTTRRTDGEFTFLIPATEYTAKKAMSEAKVRADQLDQLME